MGSNARPTIFLYTATTFTYANIEFATTLQIKYCFFEFIEEPNAIKEKT